MPRNYTFRDDDFPVFQIWEFPVPDVMLKDIQAALISGMLVTIALYENRLSLRQQWRIKLALVNLTEGCDGFIRIRAVPADLG